MKIETPVGAVELPDSVRTLSNKKTVIKTFVAANGENSRLDITLRWDDDCKNGQNTFYCTGTLSVQSPLSQGFKAVASGCIHDEIAQYAPELAHVLPYHLVDANGPMHYLVNSLFLAGDRDCWGNNKDVQVRHKTENTLKWRLPVSPFTSVYAAAKPEPRIRHFVPVLGRGKERELDTIRHVLVWPDATDEQLSQPEPELRKLLAKTFPGLDQTTLTDVLYWAGVRDCFGDLPAVQVVSKAGLPRWKADCGPSLIVDAERPPENIVDEYEPVLGGGKERELALARKSACWPDATDEELCLPEPELTKLLVARLPKLMAEFKLVIENLGFTY
jgi:hypothetical protein